jgi:hypothetical protein
MISVIVAFHEMEREAPRTLYSLSTNYQRNLSVDDYEVIAVDCGSANPLDHEMVRGFGPNFRLLRYGPDPSPAGSINAAAKQAKGEALMICIDGARILSPGIMDLTLSAIRQFEDPVVATLAFHLGPKVQNLSILDGYDRSVEDELLATIDWQHDGYELFKISSLALSSRMSWKALPTESNCVTMSTEKYWRLGGMDEAFRSPGGGLLNPDFFLRACSIPGVRVLLLGEATFHQFHGGVATNVPKEKHPGPVFWDEYFQIRGKEFEFPDSEFELFGELPDQALPYWDRL